MANLNDKLINYSNLAEFQIKLLNDLAISEKSTWSSDKLSSEMSSYATIAYVTSELAGKADAADLNSYATIAYVTSELAGKADAADLNSYATIAYVTSELTGKQDVLAAGANIEIANNTISSYGFVFDKSKGAFAEQYFDDDNNIIATNTATGIGAHAEGYATTASGDYGAHAEGYDTKATYTAAGGFNHGVGAHAEGWGTEAKHDGAHAEGISTLASQTGAHAEGLSSTSGGSIIKVTASGAGSHAEGYVTMAQNMGEHAEGFGNVSHTSGVANPKNSASDTLSSIGSATLLSQYGVDRRNVREFMYNGDCYILGIGNYDGIHIKNEQGAPENTATLQEVIANKANVYEVATPAEIQALFTPAQ